MKKGDKVVLKRFESNGVLDFTRNREVMVGREVEVNSIHSDGTFSYGCNNWWLQSACESAEKHEYFYVGQTVYSPLFHNKERKAVIEKIDKSMNHPILCKGYNVNMSFRLDGKYIESQDFVSLFQEPIQFPVNKPIETFEEGEIVEYSNDGVHWGLGYYVGIEKGEEHQYKVCTFKGMHDKLDSYGVWAKIKKFK